MERENGIQNLISQAAIARIQATFQDEGKTSSFLHAITAPPKIFYLRLNITKTDAANLLPRMQALFPTVKLEEGPLSNTIILPIKGPKPIQKLKKRIYCDKFAAESIMLGADLFVPGVRGIPDKFERDELLSVEIAPTELNKAEVGDPQNDGNTNQYFGHIANGRAVIASWEYPKVNSGLIIHTTDLPYETPNYRQSLFYQEGDISDQSLPANLATALLAKVIFSGAMKEVNPQDAIIFDTCSAPGHKTCALAEWGRWHFISKGVDRWLQITSIDRSPNRLDHLVADIVRLRLENINIVALHLEKVLKRFPDLREKANYLIFDPPCSALGTRPKLFIEKTEKELDDYPKNQRRLLKVVDPLLRHGGYLMYNTCTILKEENEGIVDYAVAKLGYQLENLPVEGLLTKSQIEFLNINPGIPFNSLSKAETDKLLRFFPTLDNGQGYFIALLRKP